MYTTIYCKFGPMLTNSEMDEIFDSALLHLDYHSEFRSFFDAPYSGSEPFFVAFGINVKCDIKIFEQFDISSFIKTIDETELKEKYNIALEKFKSDVLKSELYKDFDSDDITYLNKILDREPRLHFYFGTS